MDYKTLIDLKFVPKFALKHAFEIDLEIFNMSLNEMNEWIWPYSNIANSF